MLSLLIAGVLGVAVAQEPNTGKPLTSSRHTPTPFQRLFAVGPITVPGALPTDPRPAEPRRSGTHTEVFKPQRDIIERGPCNMPIVIGDASIDRGILIPRGHHGDPFKMRVVRPEACGEKKK